MQLAVACKDPLGAMKQKHRGAVTRAYVRCMGDRLGHACLREKAAMQLGSRSLLQLGLCGLVNWLLACGSC